MKVSKDVKSMAISIAVDKIIKFIITKIFRRKG